MQEHHNRWLWYGVYALVLVALGIAVHQASERVDYIWRWERLPQYVVSTEGEELRAPFDGFVALSADRKSLTLTELKGAGHEVIGGYDELLVGEGDLVFQND